MAKYFAVPKKSIIFAPAFEQEIFKRLPIWLSW